MVTNSNTQILILHTPSLYTVFSAVLSTPSLNGMFLKKTLQGAGTKAKQFDKSVSQTFIKFSNQKPSCTIVNIYKKNCTQSETLNIENAIFT